MRRFEPEIRRVYVQGVIMSILMPLLLTLSLPREYFDPHIGVDRDLFCRLYYGIQSPDAAPSAGLAAVARVSAVERVEEYRFLPSAHVPGRIPIRAPPLLALIYP